MARAVAPALRYWRNELAMAEEPPVPCIGPNARLLYSLASAGAYSVRTSDQSASSSSATSEARPVVLPWPISWCLQITVTRLSVPTRTNAFGASGPVAAPSWPGSAASALVGASQPKPMTSPVAPALCRNTRRDSDGARNSSLVKRFMNACMVSSLARELRRCGVDRRADALVGRAAADVACHRAVDVGVARLGLLLEQDDRRHDLSRLAIAALHDVEVYPRLLHRLRGARRNAFDGGHRTPGHRRDRYGARTQGLSVDVIRARAAFRDP